MASIDIFNDDAFSMTSLTDSIAVAPYKPKMLGSLGLFQPKPQRTTTAWIEKVGSRLHILQTAPRGAVENVRSSDKRKAYPFRIPHVPQFQTVLADDIQNVRATGSETELKAMASHVNEQLIGMRNDHEVTHEYHRIGALKGLILDADGSTIYDLFDEFNLTQTTHSFVGTVSSLTDMFTGIIRTIANKCGNDVPSRILCLCGDEYFDAIVGHDTMKSAYDRWRDGEFRRVSQLGPAWYEAASMNGFEQQNILFLNYRGQIDSTRFIETDEAYYVPVGIPGLFQEVIGPADTTETVNTLGKLIYVMQERMKFNKGIELHSQSNALEICTRPDVIVKSTYSATSSSS